MYKPATWCESDCEPRCFCGLPIDAKGSLATRVHEGHAMAHGRSFDGRRID
jgi:hypothetical protein